MLMLQIAGGIVLAVLILATLPSMAWRVGWVVGWARAHWGKLVWGMVVIAVVIGFVVAHYRSSPGGHRMKSFDGAPATLGSVAASLTRAIVWCKDCRHQVEPDTAEEARRYGAATSVPDYAKRLVCSQCGSHNTDFVLTRARKVNKPISAT